jgi:hypothetical protein
VGAQARLMGGGARLLGAQARLSGGGARFEGSGGSGCDLLLLLLIHFHCTASPPLPTRCVLRRQCGGGASEPRGPGGGGAPTDRLRSRPRQVASCRRGRRRTSVCCRVVQLWAIVVCSMKCRRRDR